MQILLDKNLSFYICLLWKGRLVFESRALYRVDKRIAAKLVLGFGGQSLTL